MPQNAKLYRTYPRACPKAIAIICPDPRVFEAQVKYFYEELRYEPHEVIFLTVFGGVLHASESMGLPPELHIDHSVRFGVESFGSLAQVHGVNHQGCLCYAEMQKKFGFQFLRGMSTMEQLQMEHLLKTFPEQLQATIPGRVEAVGHYLHYFNNERTQCYFRKAA